MPRAGPGRWRLDQSGSVSFELVLLVPVLVLLTVFVLWAGRGGRVALTADLAAEEAAAAAALCCEEGDAGGPDRDVLVEGMLEARPGLEFLCVGGLRPEAPAEDGVGPDEFVGENWLEFEPGSGARSGGVGVLGVQFSCRTDGAVAPLRGLFPTVTFHGQASEVVLRDPPRPDVGFVPTVSATEGPGTELVFTVTSGTPVPQAVTVGYIIDAAGTTATDPSDDNPPLDPADYSTVLSGTVTIPSGQDSATITVDLLDDELYEGTEYLVLGLDPASVQPPGVARVDLARLTAVGTIVDDDPPPYLFLYSGTSACQVTEGDAVTLEVRLRDETNSDFALSADPVTVDVTTEDVTATAGTDYTVLDTTETVSAGDTVTTVTVQTLDDSSSPVGEPTETFKVVLDNATGASLGAVAEVICEILDDEVRVTVAAAAVDEGDQLIFSLRLDRALSADIAVDYRLIDHNLAAHRAERGSGPCAADDTVDYLELSGSIMIPSSHDHNEAVDLPAVTTCEDVRVEHAETFWLEISIPCRRRRGCRGGRCGRGRHDPQRRHSYGVHRG